MTQKFLVAVFIEPNDEWEPRHVLLERLESVLRCSTAAEAIAEGVRGTVELKLESQT